MFRVEFWIVSTLFCCGVIAGLVLSWPDSKPPVPAVEADPAAGDHAEHAEPPVDQTNAARLLRSLAFELGLDEELSLEETEGKLLRSADQSLLLGTYGGALKLIRTVLQVEQSHPDPVVLCRLGLAEELRGNYPLAEKAYLQAIKRPTSRPIEILGLTGLARVWLLNDKPAEAIELLSDILLQSRRFKTDSEFLEGEVLTLLATAQRQQGLRGQQLSPFSPDGVDLAPPEIELEPAIEVLQANSVPRPMLASGQEHAAAAHDSHQEPEAHQAEQAAPTSTLRVISRESDQASSILLLADLEVLPLTPLLEQLATTSGLKLELDPAAIPFLQGRSKALQFEQLSLGLVLDGLLGPIHLGWSQDGDVIRVSVLEESTESPNWIHAAGRTWQHFLQLVPRDRRQAYAHYEQGNLQLLERNYDEAATRYQAALQVGARDDMAARIHLNQARINAALGRTDEAIALLFRAIDTATNKHVAALAYFLISQLQAQQGQLEASLNAASRAISLSQEEPLTAQAVLQQTRIYLLQNKPFAANQAVYQRRELFAGGTEREVAALISSLSRLLGSELPEARRNESYRLVSVLQDFTPNKPLSTIDRYLVGRAWQALGFDALALSSLEAALAQATDTYWRDRLLFELAIEHQRHNDYQQAIKCYEHLAQADNLETATAAKLQILEARLDLRQFPEAIIVARELLAAKLSPEQQKSVLTSLGLAYRQMGEPYAAALCFAGMLPQENLQK
ncbi:MAG: tetratricopeptide repeat protein [Planctomycetota bacterium]